MNGNASRTFGLDHFHSSSPQYLSDGDITLTVDVLSMCVPPSMNMGPCGKNKTGAA